MTLYLEKESFLLAIMTKFQAQMFEMFSHKVVCVDSTHKTNPYGFNPLGPNIELLRNAFCLN